MTMRPPLPVAVEVGDAAPEVGGLPHPGQLAQAQAFAFHRQGQALKLGGAARRQASLGPGGRLTLKSQNKIPVPDHQHPAAQGALGPFQACRRSAGRIPLASSRRGLATTSKRRE